MKVVLFHFNNSFSRPLVRRILSKIEASEVHNFWPLPVMYKAAAGESLEAKIFERYREVLALFSGNDSVLDFNAMKPLDAPKIQAMAYMENEAKRIICRYPFYYPGLVRANQKGIAKVIDDWFCFTGNRHSSNAVPYYDLNQFYLRILRYWFDFFEHKKVDLVLAEFVPHGAMDFIGFNVARHLGIPVVFSYFTHSTMFQYFLNDYRSIGDDVLNRMADLKKQYGPNEIKLNKGNQAEWDRLTQPAGKQKMPWGGDVTKIRELEQLLSAHEAEVNRQAVETFPETRLHLDDRTRFLVRISNLFLRSSWAQKFKFEKKQSDFYEARCVAPDPEAKYVYFPLHFQPEATSLPLGGVYENQLLVVQMLNYHLPEGWRIYVKEHNVPSDQNNRPLSFYEELLKNNKVQFISKKISTFELIEHCQATATLTGTAGWEGLFKNKPCLFFGYHMSQYAPGVFPVRTNEDCASAILQISKRISIALDDLRYFMKALEEVCIPTSSERFVYVQKELSEEEWLETMANGYASTIRKTVQDNILITHDK